MNPAPRVFRRPPALDGKTLSDLDASWRAVPLSAGEHGPKLELGTWGPGDAWGLRSASWSGKSKAERVLAVVFTESVFSRKPGEEAQLLLGEFAALESTRLERVEQEVAQRLKDLGFVEAPLEGFDYPTLLSALASVR
jgi:hypothetical protein